jgi:hypothetical protein
MLWIVVVALVLVVAVLVYCVAMSSEQNSWLRTRRELLGRDRTPGRG